MLHQQQPAISLFSIGMIGLGLASVISRDFAFGWQPVPPFHPGRGALALSCGLFMIAVSVALLFRATATLASQLMLPFLLAWLGLMLPAVIAAPRIEGVWGGFGEIGMLLAGGWVLFARLSEFERFGFLAGDSGIRVAQIIFGVSVIPVGLGHIFYVAITASLVPTWLPFRVALAYLTGIAQIACGLGILFRVFARAAALCETVMLALFAFLVWGPNTWFSVAPKLAGTPSGPRFPLTAFFITWVIGASAWLIGNNSGAEAVGCLRSSQGG